MNRVIALVFYSIITSAIFAQQAVSKLNISNNDHLSAGISYYENGELEKAKEKFELASQKNPSAYCWLGLIELERGHYLESVNYFNNMTDKAPDCLYSKAVSLFYLERYKDASKVLNTAIKLNPDDDNYYHLQSNILLKNGQYNKALAAIEKAIQLHSTGDHFFVQGLIFEELNMPGQAAISYGNSFNMLGDLTALYNKARMEWQQGFNSKAISHLDTIILMNPGDCDAYLLKARVYGSEEKYDLVIKQLNSLPDEIDCNLEDILWIKGYAYYGLHLPDSALHCFSELIHMNDSLHGYFFQRGLCFLDLKSFENAIDDFEKAITLDPANGKYYYYLSKAYEEIENQEKASKALKKSIKLNYVPITP